MSLVLLTTFFSAAMRRLTTTPVLKSVNMSDGGDIWLSRGFSVTSILSAFIGAVMVGMLLGEPDVLILFGALGGVMVGAVFYVVAVGVIRRLFWQRRSARPIERSERQADLFWQSLASFESAGMACADPSAWSSCHTFISFPQAWPNQSSIASFVSTRSR